MYQMNNSGRKAYINLFLTNLLLFEFSAANIEKSSTGITRQALINHQNFIGNTPDCSVRKLNRIYISLHRQDSPNIRAGGRCHLRNRS